MSSKTTIEYVSKADDSRMRQKKQVVVDRELDRIYEKHGTITTDLLVQVAADVKHPLHRYFEWDDSVAAKKYRAAQATAMIMASKMVLVLSKKENGDQPRVISAEKTEVRRLVAPFRGDGFKMRNKALDVDEERAAIIERKKSVLRSWCREAADIAELNDLRSEILKLL